MGNTSKEMAAVQRERDLADRRRKKLLKRINPGKTGGHRSGRGSVGPSVGGIPVVAI